MVQHMHLATAAAASSPLPSRPPSRCPRAQAGRGSAAPSCPRLQRSRRPSRRPQPAPSPRRTDPQVHIGGWWLEVVQFMVRYYDYTVLAQVRTMLMLNGGL